MIASYRWLGELAGSAASVDDVAARLTARGLTVDAVTAEGDDHALEIDVPANRPDCLGHLGLARELAASEGRTLPDEPSTDLPTAGAPVEDAFRVAIETPDGCGRFTATLVRGVRVAPSPEAVVRRLGVCGLRSINNVVDASNLVLLETGQPIHFYDADRLRGGLVRAVAAEGPGRFRTLDDQDRPLDAETLLIADAEGPIGLAGIMGGADSEIRDTTRDVLIEAAWFAPGWIRRTARRLGMHTDASHRFERGTDPGGVLRAQRLARRLLVELAGGTAAPGCIDEHPRPYRPVERTLRRTELPRLLGYAPGDGSVDQALGALGLRPRSVPDGWQVTIPSWRVDLEHEADLVEEVARHVGYDAVPTASPSVGAPAPSAAERRVEERARDLAASLGFHEAFGYSMVGSGEDAPWIDDDAPAPLMLTHPIADWLSRMRRSILPTLRRAAEHNQRRGLHDVRLFEVGRVFLSRTDGSFPHESLRLGLAWSGAARPRHWSGDNADVELHDLQGVVDRLLDALMPGVAFELSPEAPAGFQPGRALTWAGPGGTPVARAGAVHPEIQSDLPAPLFLAELVLDGAGGARTTRYRPIPRYPSVQRDLAVVLPATVRFRDVRDALEAVAAPAPATFDAVDRYVGPPLDDDASSLTVRVTLTPYEGTLTDEEIDTYRRSLIECLEGGLGLSIRHG